MMRAAGIHVATLRAQLASRTQLGCVGIANTAQSAVDAAPTASPVPEQANAILLSALWAAVPLVSLDAAETIGDWWSLTHRATGVSVGAFRDPISAAVAAGAFTVTLPESMLAATTVAVMDATPMEARDRPCGTAAAHTLRAAGAHAWWWPMSTPRLLTTLTDHWDALNRTPSPSQLQLDATALLLHRRAVPGRDDPAVQLHRDAIVQLTPAIIARIEELEIALAHYVAATSVSSWAREQLEPDWAIARAALGLPELSIDDQGSLLGQVPVVCGSCQQLTLDATSWHYDADADQPINGCVLPASTVLRETRDANGSRRLPSQLVRHQPTYS